MLGLLGKITAGKAKIADPQAQAVSFRPVSVLPLRTPVPEWLKDRILTVARSIGDARELGGPGDSIVIGAAEAARWLRPLTVSPAIIEGDPPEVLRVALSWWHEDTPPELTAVAAGRRVPVELTRDGDRFAGSVPLAALRGAAGYPEHISIEGAGLKALCALAPACGVSARAIDLPHCRGYRLRTPWLSLDVDTDHYAGCIAGLAERGREIDHFARPDGIIQLPCEHGGQYERVKFEWSWNDAPRGQKAVTAGARQEGGAIRLDLQGIADPGREMRTSAAYTAYEAIPLVTAQREYSLHPKTDEKDDGTLKEPIDRLSSPTLGIRSASLAERNGTGSSRVLLHDGARLVSARGGTMEMQGSRSWALRDGWALLEHPGRRSRILYLFDTDGPPTLKVWNAAHEISVEPQWHAVPVAPGGSFGITMGIVAGEAGGASTAGAWVGVKTPDPDGGMRWAIVARLALSTADRSVTIVSGQIKRSASLEPFHVTGIGTLYTAVVTLPDAGEAAVDITAAGIESKRQP